MVIRAEEKVKFNPIPFRKNFEEWALEAAITSAYNSADPMGNIAAAELEEVICGWLVGITHEFIPVIPRLIEWLDRRIFEDEEFGQNREFHRLTMHWARALGLWMRDNVNDRSAWDRARINAKASMVLGVWSKNDMATLALDDYLALCYQAEQDSEAITAYEACYGNKPISLKKVLKPREFAYALCLQRTGQPFDKNALLEAGRKMLRANLEENWLGGGQYARAATWLKIVYWHLDPTLTPVQTVHKAYDDMPNVPRPVSRSNG